MKRVVAAGLAAAATYALVVVGTAVLTDRDTRPLFDATGPPPVYRWVKPPPDFAAGNIRPRRTQLSFGLKPEDPPPTGASEDQQFIFSLPRGALVAAPADTQVVATVEPLDPDMLGPLPAGTFADGNAYHVTFVGMPSGQPATLSRPGSILLTVPVPSSGAVLSEDGQTWRTITSQHASANTTGAEMSAPGYFLATTPDVIGFSDDGGGGGRLLVPIAVTVVVAGALVAIPAVRRRRR